MSDEGDAQKQSTAIGNAVTAGAKVIFVNPCDINAIVPRIAECEGCWCENWFIFF